MTGAEKGLLMLCCQLGDVSVKTMTFRQFYGLRKRMESLDCPADKELTESDLRAIGLPAELATQILRMLDRERELEAYLLRAARYGIYPITRIHPDYPRVLEQKLKSTAPAVLFCKGDVRLLNLPCVSLVGSRKIHEPNRRFARRVGELAAEEGYCLVSGGASGADREAQEACLQNGGRVLVFTPDRLDKQPEKENVLYCSEGGWELGFSAQRALGRNRLIHAMGEKTFVAQCNAGHGGSWRGAEENLKNGYSRLFVFWDESEGAAGLLQSGAIEVTELTSIRNLKTGQESFFE